jgi:hypothetical protein
VGLFRLYTQLTEALSSTKIQGITDCQVALCNVNRLVSEGIAPNNANVSPAFIRAH